MQEIIFEFLFCDGPVISDLIRCLIYSYLFLESIFSPQIFPPIGNSPLQSHLLFQRTHPLFWCIQNKFSRYFLIIHKYEYLQMMVFIAKVSWICCIIGFGGIISRLITAILIFILSTTTIGIGKTGISHRWYVPVWTLISLIFIKNKQFSIDYLINEYIDRRYTVEFNNIIFDSGFPSKFIQCISLYTLFAAGISKLRHSGIQWISPDNLAFHLSDPTLETYGIFPLFRHKIRQMVLNCPSILFLMSTSSLLIELFSIVGIIIESTRIPIVIAAYLFHFGIWFFLSPNYLPQCICYLMIIGTEEYSCVNMSNVCLMDLLVVIVGIMIIFGYVLSLIIEYEGWPFTSVPMYSLDRSQFTHQYLIDENQFEKMMKNEFVLLNGITIGGEDQFSEGPTWIRITKNNENVNLIEEISDRLCVIEHAFRQSLWSAILRSIHISKNEINIYLEKISELIYENDFLNLEIHFRNGWKIYSTTRKSFLPIRDLLLKMFSLNENQQRICSIFNGNQLTIGQLRENAEKISSSLINYKLVGICMNPSFELLSTLCGVILRGIAYVPLEPTLSNERIQFIKNDSQLELIIRENFHFEENKIERKTKKIGEDIFCLMYTSGSTGQPKSVYLSQKALLNRLNWQWSTFEFVNNDICCLKTSISFVDSIAEIFAPLLQHIPIVIIPKSILINMNQFVNLLSIEQITRIILVPSLLSVFIDYLQNNNEIHLFNLHFLISSGENLSVNLIKSFFNIKDRLSKDCCLLNFYGSTEVMGDVTYEIFQSNIDLIDKISCDGRTSIGYPIDNIKIDLDQINEQGIGQIVVQETNSTFYTGDLAKFISNRLFYYGRQDNQIKLSGNRIDLSEIEFILKEHYNCKEPIVIYIPDNQIIVVFLKQIEQTIDLNRISLEKYLPSYAIPSYFIRIHQIPYLTSGKIDRQSLLNNYFQPFDQIGILRENLNKNFFQAGGTSLNAIILLNKLHANGFSHLTLDQLLNESTKLTNLFQYSIDKNPSYEIIPLNKINKENALNIIIESFSNLGEIDQILHCNREDLKCQHKQEWRYLLDQRWTFYIENSFSFGLVSTDGNLVGICLCNHFKDEPQIDLKTIPLLAPVFHLIEINENQLLNQLNDQYQPILHNFLTTINPDLESRERLLVMYFLEEQVLNVASKNKFRSVLTANASSVTKQLSEYIFKYDINRIINFSPSIQISISIKQIYL